ncbi:MAG: glycine cleavage system protein H [Candidatus Aenigmarchaeota archaeon]|nr:glycine cleavage system protein H [Candidatus Aenigmarchaeota archaeon]
MKYKNHDLPEKLLYNCDSAWLKIDGDVATLGIIEPVAKAIKEFLFAKLPEKGGIKKGEVWLSLEALKWSGHLKSPVSGEVVEVNEKVYDEPDLINKDPYGTWIIKIKLCDKSEIKELKRPEQIVPWLDEVIK